MDYNLIVSNIKILKVINLFKTYFQSYSPTPLSLNYRGLNDK